MKTLDRRSFIKNSSLAMAGIVFAKSAFAKTNINHRLSFSTLGCPNWSLSTIINCAADNGYNGIEIRGLLGQLDLTIAPDFNSADKITAIKNTLADKQLEIICLGASTQLHNAAGTTARKNNLDEAKRYIDLAQQLNAKFVRVFPETLPSGEAARNATMDLISQGLIELANYTNGSNVNILLESHGGVIRIADLLRVMGNSENSHVGMIWDMCNMWSVTRETPTSVYASLKKYIKHLHIKDLKGSVSVLLGKGDAPILETVQVLEEGNYDGYYSFEWEKWWYPTIEEPEIALPHFSTEVKKYFNTVGISQDIEMLPKNYSLSQNYPNPFNPSTSINYQLPVTSYVNLKVFDMLGREVATLVNEQKSAGNHTARWDASNLPSGVYFYRITANEFVQTKKLELIK